MAMPNQSGLTTFCIFSCDSVNGVKVYNPTAKAFQTLAAAGVTVPVQQVLDEWQESGLFMAVNNGGVTVVKVWNGSAWVTKSAV
jgi:hypothetical protein